MANGIFNGDFLNTRSKTITLAAIVLVLSSVASRLLGIFRDWLISETFGATSDSDIYFAAFRIPDFIYNILIFGGIVVAFLPLFSEYYVKNRAEAWKFANNTLNTFLVFLVALCGVLFLFTPQLVVLITPGFTPGQIQETILLTRLMFLSPILFGAASIFSGILQYFQRFLAFSMAPALYNLGIIAGILIFAPTMGIASAAIGVIAGALMYLLIQIPPSIKCGFCYKPMMDFGAASLKRVFGLMVPRTFGIAASQINQVVTTSVASALSAGSISIFNLANNVAGIPVGIFGISYAMAAFPEFSKYVAGSNTAELARKFSSTFRQIAYIVVPAGFLIFALRDLIVSAIYFHGKFSVQAASLTSASLGLLSLGICFSALLPVMFRFFFALHDTASPTVSTVVSVAVNIALNFFFIHLLAVNGAFASAVRGFFGLSAGDISVLGLAIAYTLASIVQFAVLAGIMLWKDARLVLLKEIASSIIKIFAAGAIAFVVVFLIHARIGTATSWGAFFELALAGVAGALVYIASTALFKSPEFDAVVRAAVARKKNGTSAKTIG